jgi:hypothetical protein
MRARMRERSYQNGCRSRDACPTESLRPLHAPMRRGSLGRTLHTSPGTPPVLDARRRECRKHIHSRELERLRSRRSDAAPAPTVERRTRSHAHSGRRVRAYARPRASGASRVPTRSGRLLEVRTRRPLFPAVGRCDWMKAEMRRPESIHGNETSPIGVITESTQRSTACASARRSRNASWKNRASSLCVAIAKYLRAQSRPRLPIPITTSERWTAPRDHASRSVKSSAIFVRSARAPMRRRRAELPMLLHFGAGSQEGELP